ncbi:MAG: hypothetical protein QOH29_971 [Actinomycetota bacterium]|jgi:hypothetical protein|nr:hypothetical protein [Actinomycetota bacterium]
MVALCRDSGMIARGTGRERARIRCIAETPGWESLLMKSRPPCAVAVIVLGLMTTAGCASSSTISSSAPWALIYSAPSQAVVVVEYFHGHCDSLAGGTVHRTDTSVSIKLTIRSRPGVYDSALVATPVLVRLGGTLDHRVVRGICHPAAGSLCQPSSRIETIPAGTAQGRTLIFRGCRRPHRGQPASFC